MAAHDGSIHEGSPQKVSCAFCIIQIRHGSIRCRFIQPFGMGRQDGGPRLWGRDGSRKELPIGFGVQMAGV